MKIYTKTGDSGETSLIDGQRVKKNHWRLEAYGSLDELNSYLGLIISELKAHQNSKISPIIQQLNSVQVNIFTISSHLASETKDSKERLPPLSSTNSTELETWMDEYTANLEPLKHFILPGGEKTSCLLHIARTITRRTERIIAAHLQNDDNGKIIFIYINRLSDYLFILARYNNSIQNTPEIVWSP